MSIRGYLLINHAEGFNSRIGSKKQISKHPNPYMLVEEFKRQLGETSDTVLAQVGKSKRQNPSLRGKIQRQSYLEQHENLL